MAEDLRSLNNPLCVLAECPLWREDEQCLYWTDIIGCRIWRYDPKSGKSEAVWSGNMQVGGLAFCEDGGMLLAGDKGVFKLHRKRRSLQLLCEVGLADDERFNDVTTDPAGRVLAGTMRSTLKNGRLFLLERGREPICLLEGLGISNGMGFSSDLKFFYHTDSVPRTITQYRYDLKSGRISNGRIWYKTGEKDGCPDGMTIDSEDCIWTACWGAGCVIRLDRDGKELSRISAPALQVTSVTFGGPRYNTLYITTAAKDAVDPWTGCDERGRFLGGRVYEMDCETIGRRAWPAKF